MLGIHFGHVHILKEHSLLEVDESSVVVLALHHIFSVEREFFLRHELYIPDPGNPHYLLVIFFPKLKSEFVILLLFVALIIFLIGLEFVFLVRNLEKDLRHVESILLAWRQLVESFVNFFAAMLHKLTLSGVKFVVHGSKVHQ